MKLDTLVGMAKETAAFGVHPSGEYIYSFYTEQLQAFARLIAQHAKAEEREACAKLCDDRVTAYQYATDVWAQEHIDEARHLAKAIRARGEASIRGQA